MFFFVAGSAILVLIYAVFAPWGFFLGGHFHPIPYWQGWGRMKSSTAGDYVLFVRMFPAPAGSPHQSWNLKGRAYLCTPKGERFRLNLGGTMPKHFWVDSSGQPLHLYLFYWPTLFPQLNREPRPRISLYGEWGNSELLMEDHKTVSAAFLPDGTLNTSNAPHLLTGKEELHITLREGSYSEFDAACQVRRR